MNKDICAFRCDHNNVLMVGMLYLCGSSILTSCFGLGTVLSSFIILLFTILLVTMTA